jgi:hypothetical protein
MTSELKFMLLEDKKCYRVSLRLVGEGLPLDEIEMLLGITPSYLGKKGKHLHGNSKYAKHKSNVWNWRYPMNSNTPFEEQIRGVLNTLEPKLDSLKEILSLPNVDGELFLGFSSGNGQGGAVFSVELLKRIAEFGLSLSLDLYPPDIDQEEEFIERKNSLVCEF